MSVPEELSRYQQAALSALLKPQTLEAAAAEVGVTERTLRRWLAEDVRFRAALRDARQHVLDSALADLSAVTTEAVDTLRQSLGAESEQVRVRASALILDIAVRERERAENSISVRQAESFVSELREVLRHHIDEPEILGAIGRDMLAVSRRYHGTNEQNGGTHAR